MLQNRPDITFVDCKERPGHIIEITELMNKNIRKKKTIKDWAEERSSRVLSRVKVFDYIAVADCSTFGIWEDYITLL